METKLFATWAQVMGTRDLESDVIAALGDFANGYNITGIVDTYRSQINQMLPTGVCLAGEAFYGPSSRKLDVHTLKEIVQSVNFWSMVYLFVI